MNKIRDVGAYFERVWKASGMRMENVRMMWASDEINAAPDTYWNLVMQLAMKTSISRVKRCGTIMGRSEGDDQPAAQVMYPLMQAADIFFLGADICQLGMDQRKVNMLAREFADKANLDKPIIVSHHMLAGLTGEKMSKSDPNSAIFMEDSTEDITRKIKGAFCEPENIEKNPVLEYCRYVIYESGVTILGFETYQELEDAYASGAVHPSELKPPVAEAIDALIEPVRSHFQNDPVARDLFKRVQSYRVTK